MKHIDYVASDAYNTMQTFAIDILVQSSAVVHILEGTCALVDARLGISRCVTGASSEE